MYGRRRIDLSSIRYIVGYGKDGEGRYVGVWDRHAPGPPVRVERERQIADVMREWIVREE